MEQFKRLLRKLFFPKPWMTLLSIPVAAVLLIYTFAGGHKEDWIAIPAMSPSSCISPSIFPPALM